MYEITKDKYEISIWEDVLIPAEEQTYELSTGDINISETYYTLVEKKSINDDEANTEPEYEYEKIPAEDLETFQGDRYIRVPRKLSFFQEQKIAVIGANDHNAPELAYNPKFVVDVKGEHTLTFTMNSKYYDKEKEVFVDNPFIKQLANEKKVKLFFRDEWYDLIIKKVEENKKNYAYTYTANDLFINELGKNGFKVELDTELENNQGTAEELAAQVLEETDWIVSSYADDAEYKSDLIVETNLDTLYKATLSKDVLVKVSADGWLPIREDEVEPGFISGIDDKQTQIIKKGEQIYLFYSDLISKNTEPMILYRALRSYDDMGNVSADVVPEEQGGVPVYETNDNEDIIINSFNFRVTRENKVSYNDDSLPLPDFIDLEKGIELETSCRGYETVRKVKTGYDPVTDEFITYFLQRLYTKDYVETNDVIPYSNKAYFTDKSDEARFYGFVFETAADDVDTAPIYYEEKYTEFLQGKDELDENTQYYVKSLVPEYVPTLDKCYEADKSYYKYYNEEYQKIEAEIGQEIDQTENFIYEQTGKTQDGYIKFEKSTWAQIKGYSDTEYLSPTLVQNYLVNSLEIADTNGWLLDGAPSAENRAGEIVNRLDDPTLDDSDDGVTSSLLLLHLTDSPVYYASQTGGILYTNYGFKELNPQIESFETSKKYYQKIGEYVGTEPVEESYENGFPVKDYCLEVSNGCYQSIRKIGIKIDGEVQTKRVLRFDSSMEGTYCQWTGEEWEDLSETLVEANRYVDGAVYFDKDRKEINIKTKWDFLTFDKQLYFKVGEITKDIFYSIVNYDESTPIYVFDVIDATTTVPAWGVPYYVLDDPNSASRTYTLVNKVEFEDGVNDYFVKNENDEYKKVLTNEPIDGETYYIFAPTGKMQYLSYDYYSEIWERAAIRDYLDSVFLAPDYETYYYFNPVRKSLIEEGKSYWIKAADGTYKLPTDQDFSNYEGEYVYEKWDEDAITEMQSIYSFEYVEDELTAYAKSLLELVYELLDWVDYNQESKLEFLNAIDLFGIKRATLLQKLRALEKSYPDVEGYQKQTLLEYLNTLNTDLNQKLRIEMSVIADKNLVNYFPTKDTERIEGKRYYVFSTDNHTNGEVSAEYIPELYIGETFVGDNSFSYTVDGKIIYEFEGALIDLISDVETAIQTISDTDKLDTLEDIKNELNNVMIGSAYNLLNPFKVYKSYQSLLTAKDAWDSFDTDEAQDLIELFYDDNNQLLELSNSYFSFYIQSVFNKSEIDASISELLNKIKAKIAEENKTLAEKYGAVLEGLKEISGGITYQKVNTEEETPQISTTYYIKENDYTLATGTVINSSQIYWEYSENVYSEIDAKELDVDSENKILTDNVFILTQTYHKVPYTFSEWEKDSNGDVYEYYTQIKSLIDYSSDIEYNQTLRKALDNLENIIALKYDDVDELKTGNKIFDAVTESLTGFTIIWHLEKEEREQVVEGTKLLLNLAKKLTALQISEDFIDLSLDRRYEAHKRRALNTGFAANRGTIKKLNKGEEYVLAFSLGRYYEGEEPPTYNKISSVSYGDVENTYYYFDTNPSGIGDYVLGTEDYKEILKGEDNYNTPYGWAEAEGHYELAGTDATIAPRYYCIAQETTEGKFITRFVSPDSNELTKCFYYPCEDGDYIYTRKTGKTLFQTEYAFQKLEDYKWLNGELDQVLLNNGKWKVLFKERRSQAKRYRKSPTYVCMKADTTAEDIRNCSSRIYDSNIELDEIQVFKRSTDTSTEGRHKKDTVISLEGIESDKDYYKKLSAEEIVKGPKEGTIYYTYNFSSKKYEQHENLEVFNSDVDYYTFTSDRRHFSLYQSEDEFPDLYVFLEDSDGDYVHIIYKEETTEVNVKWYEFWKNANNLNKIYREFKDSDDLNSSAQHYFKRYNSDMDYEYHGTAWKDGHIGPWKEKYQRYKKYRVHLYDNTELDPLLTYWRASPFSDGSECYVLYEQTPIERYTVHKRYKGMENGIHQYWTRDKILAQPDGTDTTDTANPNINKVDFVAPSDFKNSNPNINEATFFLDTSVELIPVKISNRTFRPFENENDSQRVPYVMLKSTSNSPTVDTDWIYCKGATAEDTGYYRACTVDDRNLYTNWAIEEGIDELFGLYKFLKVSDPVNWNSDDPPFSYATPLETTLLANNYAVRVIKSLNTPYWWGRQKTFSLDSNFSLIRKDDSNEDGLSELEKRMAEFWDWGNKKLPLVWSKVTGASSAEEYVKKISSVTNWWDSVLQDIAAVIRKIILLFDITKDDHIAKRLLSLIDNWGVDTTEGEGETSRIFRDPEGVAAGIVKKKDNSTFFYHYYQSETTSYYESVWKNGNKWYDGSGEELTSQPEVLYQINSDTGLYEELEENIRNGTRYFYYKKVKSEAETQNNRTPEARKAFWDAMYGLYGSQWSNIVERSNFSLGGSHFLNTEDEFTDDVLKEIYSFSELWVKETTNGLTKFVPFDATLHSAKTKYYRHTYSGALSDAIDGVSEIYYNDGGIYKYYPSKAASDDSILLNYDGLKVSFCEYDYDSSNYKIEPVTTEEEENDDYANYHKSYLDFDCNQPINGYFDLTITSEVPSFDDEDSEPLVKGIKERYVWWKAPVLNNYNLTEDLYNRVGTLFYTEDKSLNDYPIIGAQLFKYKAYKSNNYDVLIDFKRQFYDYEHSSFWAGDTCEPTLDEYRLLKEAFKGYFGIDEWKKVKEAMDLNYKGEQRNFEVYRSYLEMLESYLKEEQPKVEYIRQRIKWDNDQKKYIFNFENDQPVSRIEEELPIDTVYITLEYYTEEENGKTIVKTVSPIESGFDMNVYDKAWAEKELILSVPAFASSDQDLLASYIKSLIYKYGIREVDKTIEKPDISDLYYTIEEISDSYYYKAYEGLSLFPDTPVYQSRYLTSMDIEQTAVEEDFGESKIYHLTVRIKAVPSEKKATLKVTYQVIGNNNSLLYEPETYSNVPIYTNMDEAALAEEIERQAQLYRKDFTTLQLLKEPNPFNYYICSGVQSELIGLNNLEKDEYEVVVQLDNKLFLGHHDVSEDKTDLTIFSSFNKKIEDFTDNWLQEQEVHWKKAVEGIKQAQENFSEALSTSFFQSIKTAISNLFKSPTASAISTYSLLDVGSRTILLDNSDGAVSNSIAGALSNALRKEILEQEINDPSLEVALTLYLAQLSSYYQEIAAFVIDIQELGYYDFFKNGEVLDEDFFSNFEEKYNNEIFINRILTGLYQEKTNDKYIMALPGEIPDNNDIILTNWYLYDPELPGQDDIDTLVYEYVGVDALSYYFYDYDNLCQKVRSVEVKEKNYLSTLQEINEKFECWSKYEIAHYTVEENEKLTVSDFEKAHTPGEVKMRECVVWVAEDDETDIYFEPSNISNSHISNKQNEVISALSQFNPKDYWEARKDYQKWDGHEFEDDVIYYYETQTGAFKEVDREEVKIPVSEEIYYTKVENGNEEAVENSESAENKTYLKDIMIVPIKTIYLKQFTGELNYAGFKYGVNLNSIKRTLDSKDLVSRLIVKENTNEHALDGFCTIQRAEENPTKESFILNFDYYIQHMMLDREEVQQDLYGLEDGYYSRLAAVNKDLDNLVDEIAEINECLDEINANYETYSLARDAAQQEIEEMAVILSEYMPDGIPSPWKYNMAKETQVLRTSWSDTQTKQFTTTDEDGNVIDMKEYVVQGQTRAIEIPKYSDAAQDNLIQMDLFQRKYEKYSGLAQKAKEQKNLYEEKLKELYEKSDDMYRIKTNLNLLFFKKYYRFIQEGSWKEDSYMDDTLYYLDALSTARTSAFPKATYDISTIDLENLNDYKAYRFRIGDKTYIEDTEFFGYTATGKPYQEETIVTKLEYSLDNPAKNKITVTNYKTQFEDIFQRIAAAVSKVELSTGAYDRANISANISTSSSTNSSSITSSSLKTVNGSVEIGAEGVVTTDIGVPSNKLKIVNGAVYRSTDGGTTYQKILTADSGIDPSLIGNGRLDLTSLTIGSKDNPELSFSANGMTAFRKMKDTVDYSTFVRFDSYGMYGIKGYKRNSSTDDASEATLNDVFIPTNIDSIYENASYGLTWDGFFLKTGDGTGRVTIGTNQDLRMSVKGSGDAWSDRIVIGKLQDGEEEAYYGFRIIDNNDNVVLNTNDKGQLYLRHKLYISHFNDEYGPTVAEDGTTVDKLLDQTNVALGIVKAYKRVVDNDGNCSYENGQDIQEDYSSLSYLTKVFSVKSAADGYNLKDVLAKDNNKFDGSDLYFKQLTKENLDVLIDSNENLAIFDNGSLYARNAWIEGTVHATDGEFTGTVHATDGEFTGTVHATDGEFGEKNGEHIDITGTSIQASNGNWLLNYDGTATFKNVNVSGAISSAVFEYDKIQAIGGALLVRPSYKVINQEYDENTGILELTLQAEILRGSSLKGFSVGDYCRFGQDKFEQDLSANEKYKIYKVVDFSSESNNPVVSFKVSQDVSKEAIESIISMATVQANDKIYGYSLGLNSTAENDSFLPEQSFSLIKMSIVEDGAAVKLEKEIKILLGNLTTLGTNYTDYLTEEEDSLIEEKYYGLYAKNVLLEGSLVTINGEYSAGVNTTAAKIFDNKELVFWSGSQNSETVFSPTFYVDKTGYLFAENGEFRGTVKSSKIIASEIVGGNEKGDYGLTIIPYLGEEIAKGILFKGQKEEELFSLDSSLLKTKLPLRVLKEEKPVFSVFPSEEGVGLFAESIGTQVSSYYLNLTLKDKQVIISYQNTQIATIDSDGFQSMAAKENDWGDNIKIEAVKDSKNQNIGCDIYVTSKE